MMGIEDNSAGEVTKPTKRRFFHQRLLGPRASIVRNVALMLFAIGGLVAVARGHEEGQILVMLAMLLSLGQAAWTRTMQVPLDEREDGVLANATAIGLLLIIGMAGFWCVLIGITEKNLWFPDAALEWQTLGFFLFGLMAQTTAIAAALMTPSYAAELLDEE